MTNPEAEPSNAPQSSTAEFIKADNKRNKTVRKEGELQLSSDPIHHLGSGTEGIVTRAITYIEGRPINGLAFKEYHSEGAATNALKAYAWMKSVGIPVPTTFRLVEENGKYTGILITDLTHDWHDALITSNETKWYVLERVFETSPETVTALADFDFRNEGVISNIQQQLKEIAEKTAEKKMEFRAGDVLSATFSHDGKLELIISDMGNIGFDSQLTRDELVENNYKRGSMILSMIGEAQRIAKELCKK